MLTDLAHPQSVMPGLDPGIHVFAVGMKTGDGRIKSGHDEKGGFPACLTLPQGSLP